MFLGIRSANCIIAAAFFIIVLLAPALPIEGASIKAPLLSSRSRIMPTRESIVKSTNEARQAHKLPPLRENALLDKIASARAKDMFEKQYFAHISPAGKQASDFAQEFGYQYKVLAENLTQGYFTTGKKMVDGWMQSPSHRQNIVSSDVKEIGAAIVKGKMNGMNTSIGVQILGLQSPAAGKDCPKPSSELEAQIEEKKKEIAQLEERVSRLESELKQEKEIIGAERYGRYFRSQDYNAVNAKINAYNEKGRWYNLVVSELNGKKQVLQEMINDYNQSVKTYQNCLNSP